LWSHSLSTEKQPIRLFFYFHESTPMPSNEKILNFSKISSNKFFGFEIVSHAEESVELSMTPKPEYLQEYGVVHGAIVTAIADTSAVYLFHPYVPDDKKMTSVEFKVNFLAAAFIDKGPLKAVAKVVKKGRKIGVADVEVLQGDQLILKGLFTYLFF